MKELIFLQVVPHDLYFQWQIEVQIVNFRKFGVSDKMKILVWYPKGSIELPNWAIIQEKYPEVDIILYEDEGVDLRLYISQLRPHTLKKYYRDYEKELRNRPVFYHDSDIIFNYLPDFDSLLEGDIWWQSDCSGYLDYLYILKKEKEGNIPNNLALKKFAEIGGISVRTIKSYAGKTGGAQCILKNVDSSFWEDVENQCLAIRRAFSYTEPGSINRTFFESEKKGFQSWCADMWALNFSIWKRGFKTDITKALDFSWATDSHKKFEEKPIFHNAGAVKGGPIFYKGEWIKKSPIGVDLPLPSEDTASIEYVKAIREVK